MKPEVREEPNFYPEVNAFAKTLLKKDAEKRFIKYCTDNNLNHNERMLFRLLLAQSLEFQFTIAMLKFNCNVSPKNTDPL